GSGLRRYDGGVDRGLARDHDHGRLGSDNPKAMEDVQAGRLWHLQIEEGHVERFPFDGSQGLAAVRRGDDLVTVFAEDPRELASPGLAVIRAQAPHRI